MEKIIAIPVRRKFTPIKRTIFKYPRSGIECMFIQLTKDKGIKIFAKRDEAVRSHRRQSIAYKHELAPKVLSKVQKCFVGNLHEFDIEELFHVDKAYCYCYITQVAKIKRSYKRKMVDDLEARLIKAKMPRNDLHDGNVGIIDGKLVRIDWGDCSVNYR